MTRKFGIAVNSIGETQFCMVLGIKVSRKSTHSQGAPTPYTFDPISCIGSKFTQMSAHSGVSFA